ncbi:MAG: DUF4382 domain-containing protein [Saprospiraceae bacterium]|nr:DUF4382 domain-containing protein [Lewinella sp.]
MNRSKLVVLFLLAILATSCDPDFLGNIPEDIATSSQNTLNIHLTDDPVDLEEVNIDLKQVILKGPNGFAELPLGTKAGIYNLLDYQNGLDTLIASATDLPFTEIREIRLVLGSENSVVDDGVAYELKVPSGSQSGLKIKVCLDLSATEDVYDLILDFDAEASLHQTGNGKYILKPVIRVLLNPDAKCSGDDNDYDEEEDEYEENEDKNEDGGFIPIDNLPTDVLDYLDDNYPDFDFTVLPGTFCDGTEVYLITGKKGAQNILLYYDLDWKLLQFAVLFDAKTLPGEVVSAVGADYNGYKIMYDHAWKITRTDETTWYRVHLKKNQSSEKIYVIYAADGTLICEEI